MYCFRPGSSNQCVLSELMTGGAAAQICSDPEFCAKQHSIRPISVRDLEERSRRFEGQSQYHRMQHIPYLSMSRRI